jgi:hypothetical protein
MEPAAQLNEGEDSFLAKNKSKRIYNYSKELNETIHLVYLDP